MTFDTSLNIAPVQSNTSLSYSLPQPDKSSVSHSRVDFGPFNPLKAKIDCIVIACKKSDLGKEELKLILRIPRKLDNQSTAKWTVGA